MDLTKKLKDAGVEVTAEMEELLKGDYISVQEHEKKLNKVELERDKYKKDFENASETLKGFEDKDLKFTSIALFKQYVPLLDYI